MTAALLLGLGLVLMAIGMPVAFAIGIAGFTYFFLPETFLPTNIGPQRIVSATQSFPLLAVPLFIFIGHLMNASGITPRLMRLSTLLAGWMSGGLAQASIVLSTLMGGVSGSAVADAAMQSRVLGQGMVQQGYSPGFTGAVLSIGGLVTATIPPSIGLILYGYLGEVSIGRLFIAGVVPGFLLMVALMVTTYFVARRRGYTPVREGLPAGREVLSAARSSLWALLFPVWLLVGIRYGLFTPTEAGAFAVAYALLVGCVIHREMGWREILAAMHASVRDIGMIMLIIMFSGIIGYVVSFERVPQTIAELTLGVFSSHATLLLTLAVLLVLLGMLLEATVVVMLLTPILVPVVKAAGVDPVHFGLLMMTLVTFGGMTPPVGISMYTVCGILRCSFFDYSRELVPFALAVFVVVLGIIFFPDIVLFLPNLLMG
ncbi:TRAP transporter large permease [Halomonas sp. MCCC 1A17488]|uniref:TRAP transporter large permease protein n=1 Tax=Billgrantia sulfidoxydans TaxID=2733484 RepID=A0ABX7W3G4_9GAMM|nr:MULTISPECIES: TRAP transporter large permease [Halomonas]MCE8016082.1 TRAP transporter large permease [Halomonas sp. MCCC 1A17488]MCG3239415.1 TRAP transporter large permease [Halomonas sp. MCCC 1A17488]QPP50656.1 TRAP transporter large permease [Halomonas sp. SS10-MC5]QTP54225.1 TRAP transporter large permease [Halomonas sulfidoxydans]